MATNSDLDAHIDKLKKCEIIKVCGELPLAHFFFSPRFHPDFPRGMWLSVGMRSRIKLFPPNPLASLVFFIQTSSGCVIIVALCRKFKNK